MVASESEKEGEAIEIMSLIRDINYKAIKK